MMMCIDETRTDDFISAIDGFGLWSGNVLADFRYLVAFYENVGVDSFHYFITVM